MSTTQPTDADYDFDLGDLEHDAAVVAVIIKNGGNPDAYLEKVDFGTRFQAWATNRR